MVLFYTRYHATAQGFRVNFIVFLPAKEISGSSLRTDSRLSFKKCTYPDNGCFGAPGLLGYLFFPFGQPRFFTSPAVDLEGEGSLLVSSLIFGDSHASELSQRGPK